MSISQVCCYVDQVNFFVFVVVSTHGPMAPVTIIMVVIIKVVI